MTVINAIILGLVQGIAEFLPISSSGHLAILNNLFGMTTTENGHTYEYTTSYMRADRVKLDVRFQKGATSFMRTVD